MNKKTYSMIGIICGVLAFIFGILVLAGALGGDTSAASGSSLYSSGYASFGADFYTYVSNNAAEAASASRYAVKNLHEIASLMKAVFGIALMLFGLFSFSFFGLKYEETKVAEVGQSEIAAAEAAAEDSGEEAEALVETEQGMPKPLEEELEGCSEIVLEEDPQEALEKDPTINE